MQLEFTSALLICVQTTYRDCLTSVGPVGFSYHRLRQIWHVMIEVQLLGEYCL